MELFSIIVAGVVPIVGIVALDWDTSLFVAFFVLDSVVLGVATWFKINESDDSSAIYYEPEKRHDKVGDSALFEKAITFGLYTLVNLVFTIPLLYNQGTESFRDGGVWLAVLFSLVWQAWDYLRMRRASKPTVTMGYLVLGPFKRMVVMMFLLGVAFNDVTSTELNIAVVLTSLAVDIYFYFYKRKYTPSRAR